MNLLSRPFPNGQFITLEGPEGAGKTTQIERLRAWFESHGHDVVVVGEPGGTDFGKKIRELFLAEHRNITPEAEVALLVAAKSQLLQTVILPALDAGKVVLCDRYTDTLFAYQHHAKGHDRGMMQNILEAMNANLEPDLTILITIPAEESIRRSLKRRDEGGEYSNIDAEKIEFHQRVIDGLKYEICDMDRRYIHIEDTQHAHGVSPELAMNHITQTIISGLVGVLSTVQELETA